MISGIIQLSLLSNWRIKKINKSTFTDHRPLMRTKSKRNEMKEEQNI